MRIGAIVSVVMYVGGGGVSSFTTKTTGTLFTGRRSVALDMTTPEEERAAVLSNYLAKSHEEKLKAIKAAEEKKNAEIQALKLQLAEAKKVQVIATDDTVSIPDVATAPAAPLVDANVESMSKEELVAVVKAYQKFMANYIVSAQEQKARAVQEAVETVEKKYNTKLEAVTTPLWKRNTKPNLKELEAVEKNDKTKVEGVATPSASAPAMTAPPEAAPEEVNLFVQRSQHVAASAAAGKGRWGNLEIAKAQEAVLANIDQVPPINGVAAPADTRLYDIRNARVAAAAAVGKSRWGSLELQRVAYLTPKSLPPPSLVDSSIIPPEVIAADHGLRNDGGVGGWTLAERIAMGAKAPPLTTAPKLTVDPPPITDKPLSQPAPEEPTSGSLYRMRNLKVVAAARVGKSRWGDLEIQMAKQKLGVNPALVVVEADHGLRADGGVQGPTLADRVNLGAQLLGFE